VPGVRTFLGESGGVATDRMGPMGHMGPMRVVHKCILRPTLILLLAPIREPRPTKDPTSRLHSRSWLLTD
jgi:hypothetical protein